jgi:hypothetical protein
MVSAQAPRQIDLTGLVWDVSPPRPAAPGKLQESERRSRWDALGSADGRVAYQAMGELAADPAAAVETAKANLKATPAPTDAKVDRLVAKLDSAVFAEREAASRALGQLGALAVPRARQALPHAGSAEVRRRLEEFLRVHDRADRLTGYRLGERRAVELLEALGTPGARAFLASLAGGGRTTLAQDAAAAARRLAAR